MRDYVLTLLVAAAVTYLLTPLVRRLAIRAGAMFEPRARDVHTVPVPRMGGLAMYAGLAAGLLVAEQIPQLRQAFGPTGMVPGLLLAGGLLVVIGLIDDKWGMSALTKLAGQIAAGAILVATGTQLNLLPLPGGASFAPTPDQSTLLTILVVVATINAVNFIDGLDGLAAGIVTIAAASFLIYYYEMAQVVGVSELAAPALASAILTGVCLGFLPHNFHPARIFMGDTGAMLLGLVLAYAPISSISSLDPALWSPRVNRYPVALPLLLPAAILVIPYLDLLLAVIRRTRAGKSPFAAGQQPPAPPADRHRSLAARERAGHVPVGGCVLRQHRVVLAGARAAAGRGQSPRPAGPGVRGDHRRGGRGPGLAVLAVAAKTGPVRQTAAGRGGRRATGTGPGARARRCAGAGRRVPGRVAGASRGQPAGQVRGGQRSAGRSVAGTALGPVQLAAAPERGGRKRPAARPAVRPGLPKPATVTGPTRWPRTAIFRRTAVPRRGLRRRSRPPSRYCAAARTEPVPGPAPRLLADRT